MTLKISEAPQLALPFDEVEESDSEEEEEEEEEEVEVKGQWHRIIWLLHKNTMHVSEITVN